MDKSVYKCLICDHQNSTLNIFNCDRFYVHLKLHDKCETCGNRLCSQDDDSCVKTINKTTEGTNLRGNQEKVIGCAKCDYKCKRLSDLKKHFNSHSKDPADKFKVTKIFKIMRTNFCITL
jgi:hypothetical protein